MWGLISDYKGQHLAIAFSIIIILVYTVWNWIYLRFFTYNEYGILVSNEKKIKEKINDKLQKEDITNILASADEHRLILGLSEMNELENIRLKTLLSSNEKLTPWEHKAQLLISGFMHRIKFKDTQIINQQKLILETCIKILQYLSKQAAIHEFSVPIIIDILAFSQEFYQGLNSTNSPFLQLPYMTRNIISKLDLQNTSFKDYISLPPEKRNLSLAFNEQQIEIIESSISQLPKPST